MRYAATAEKAANAGNLFLLGMVLYAVPFLSAAAWMILAQIRYVGLYREVHGDVVPLPRDSTRRYLGDPQRWFRESPSLSWRLWRIIWEPQDDPALESARRRVVRRWWLLVTFMVVGFPIPLVVGSLGP